MARLDGYDAWSVICTISSENLRQLDRAGRFPPRASGAHLPDEHPPLHAAAIARGQAGRRDGGEVFPSALDRTQALYRKTGRRLVVGNFANILLAILAPAARRLMCDISPCGGGRCFFAVAPNGDLFPCSEFIGLDRVLRRKPLRRTRFPRSSRASRSGWSPAGRSRTSILAAAVRSAISAALPAPPRPTR